MIWNEYPYANVHELNLDWILEQVKNGNIKIKELEDIVNNKIDMYVQEYVAENLSRFLLGAMYIEERTAIKLQPVEIIGDGNHVYRDETILVMEGR